MNEIPTAPEQIFPLDTLVELYQTTSTLKENQAKQTELQHKIDGDLAILNNFIFAKIQELLTLDSPYVFLPPNDFDNLVGISQSTGVLPTRTSSPIDEVLPLRILKQTPLDPSGTTKYPAIEVRKCQSPNGLSLSSSYYFIHEKYPRHVSSRSTSI